MQYELEFGLELELEPGPGVGPVSLGLNLRLSLGLGLTVGLSFISNARPGLARIGELRIQCNIIEDFTIQYNAIPHNAIRRNAIMLVHTMQACVCVYSFVSPFHWDAWNCAILISCCDVLDCIRLCSNLQCNAIQRKQINRIQCNTSQNLRQSLGLGLSMGLSFSQNVGRGLGLNRSLSLRFNFGQHNSMNTIKHEIATVDTEQECYITPCNLMCIVFFRLVVYCKRL